MKDKEIPLDERIIYALDFADGEEARKEVERTFPHIKFYKIGLELFLASGWKVVDYVLKKNCKVMLDLKFLDIPATVSGAVKQVESHGGISLLTVHGHQQTLEAAVSVRQNRDMKILGVTLLTSFGQEDMTEFGDKNISPQDLVLIRAQKIAAAGADGWVASAHESRALEEQFGLLNFVLVTPGIRPKVSYSIGQDDQKRTATPEEAMAKGSDYLVIGRPIRSITKDEDLDLKVKEIKEEIQLGLNARKKLVIPQNENTQSNS